MYAVNSVKNKHLPSYSFYLSMAGFLFAGSIIFQMQNPTFGLEYRSHKAVLIFSFACLVTCITLIVILYRHQAHHYLQIVRSSWLFAITGLASVYIAVGLLLWIDYDTELTWLGNELIASRLAFIAIGFAFIDLYEPARCRQLPDRIVTSMKALAVIFLLATIFFTAWVSDDAFITMRTVRNWVNGYGLTWNIGERVQAYTHPLWMLLLSIFYSLTHDPYASALVPSFICTTVVIFIFMRATKHVVLLTILGICILATSRAFVDYSTSGLENPLTHLLLATYFFVSYKDTPRQDMQLLLTGLFAGLLILNRLDTAILIIPSLAWTILKNRGVRKWLYLGSGLLPFLVWSGFSVIYYGLALPNTAYAKLNTGYSTQHNLTQAAAYYLHSLEYDTVTLIAVASILAILFMSRNPRSKLYGAGIVLYLLYIFWIGGDFMSGRFFSPILLLGVFSLASVENRPQPRKTALVCISLITLALLMPKTHLMPMANVSSFKINDILLTEAKSGVVNEREFYFRCTSLYVTLKQHGHFPVCGRTYPMGYTLTHDVEVASMIGFAGYWADEDTYVVDTMALTDPFLSHLPALPDQRVGHYTRALPEGYLESIAGGTNEIADPVLSEFYDAIQLMVREEQLFSADRIRAIWLINTGYYNRQLVP